MKYLLMGEETLTLFIEDENNFDSIFYSKRLNKWVSGGTRLFDARVGFDLSEPEGSPYRFGNGSCMHNIEEISKEQAEEFVGFKIDEKEMINLLVKLNS